MKELAKRITHDLLEGVAVFENIEVREEHSQYDVLFTYKRVDSCGHQRGIGLSDLLIGIVSFGCYGFRTDKYDTDASYYKEKLGLYSDGLTELFNEIRKLICEHEGR